MDKNSSHAATFGNDRECMQMSKSLSVTGRSTQSNAADRSSSLVGKPVRTLDTARDGMCWSMPILVLALEANIITKCYEICRSLPHPCCPHHQAVLKTLSENQSRSYSAVHKNAASTPWSKKTAPFYVCNNFVKTIYSEIIIGAYILQ